MGQDNATCIFSDSNYSVKQDVRCITFCRKNLNRSYVFNWQLMLFQSRSFRVTAVGGDVVVTSW